MSRNQFRHLYRGLEDVDDDIDDLEDTLDSVEDDVEVIKEFTSCGGHGWTQVAYFDFDYDDCPPPLTPHTDDGIDTCGRGTGGDGAGQCNMLTFPVFKTYQRICGRITGYQFGATNAFEPSSVGTENLDGAYISGVSLTHGTAGSRTHIWTFAAGRGEGDGMNEGSCPCDFDEGFGTQPPMFVENDYFCESGVNGEYNDPPEFFNNRLWNGAGCEINSCCSFNAPPYFIKDLHATTNNDIDLRLCGVDAATDEDARVAQIELYVQ